MAPIPRVQTFSRNTSGMVTGERSYILYGRNEKWDRTSPAILACHGAGGTGSWINPILQAGGTYHSYMQAVADKGYIVISSDWTGDGWGNAAGTSSLREAYDWIQTTGSGCKPGQVGIFAGSAGTVAAMNFWHAGSTRVGALACFVPVFNIDSIYADVSALQAGIDAAYSGDYATNGTTHSPHTFAASLPKIEPLVWYASDDASVRTTDVLAASTALGTEPIDIGPGGHSALEQGAADVADLINVYDQGLK